MGEGRLGAFARIQMMEGEGKTEVLVNGQKYMGWETGDEESKRMSVVQLYESGIGKQEEIAEAFKIHVKSVYNYIKAYKEEGLRGLIKEGSGPQEPWKITPEMKFKILEIAYRNRDLSLEEMVKQLERRWNQKVSRNSLRMVLMENGFIKEEVRKDDLDLGEMDLFDGGGWEFKFDEAKEGREEIPKDAEDSVRIEMGRPRIGVEKGREEYSRGQRIYLDELERYSENHIEKGAYNAYGGGLLFAPLIERYDFTGMMKGIIDLATHEGYSLEEFCLTLLYFDLFRFESVENFKTVYPEEFGILIGKSQSPSIFTIRRFLHKVRKLKIGEKLMEEFGKKYLKEGLAKYGMLYIDGHFLPYYGGREITFGWNTVRETVMAGSCHFMGNDEAFNPVIFFVRASSEDLLEKIPEMISKIKQMGKEAGMDQGELTVVFDREGYCAELFRSLDKLEGEKITFITWAKYSDRWVGDIVEGQFKNSVEVVYELQEKEEIRYCEVEKEMSKYGKIRAVVIEDVRTRHRSAIYTNNRKKGAGEIISLICRRWGQENLIKTLKLEHLIDYHPGYVSEELEEQPLVENPQLLELKRKRSNLLSQLHELELKFAERTLDKTKDETSWREIKTAELDTLSQIAIIKSQITLVKQEIEKLPKEVKYDEANSEKLVVLDHEKKRFMDCIKVFAYHMEKKMCEILLKYYDVEKRDEIYPLLHMVINRGANIRLAQGRLLVRLRGFKNPEVSYAARRLCEELNQMNPVTLDRFRLPICYQTA